MTALRPQDVVAHHALGMALETQGRYEEALGAYEEAMRLDPSLAAAQFGIGAAQLHMGRSTCRSQPRREWLAWIRSKLPYY